MKSIALQIFVLFAALGLNCSMVSSSGAATVSTFPARVTLSLCPEYKFGGVTVDIKYTIGANLTLQDAAITAQGAYDSGSNTRAYDIELPNFYGTQPLKVSAYCRNSIGLSRASNALVITNCNNLALYDDDNDGMPNSAEDTNCDNFYSPGDFSNPHNVDTDGDGVRDLVEFYSATDPSNPGSSPRPFIFSSGPFDPDGDISRGGSSNAVVWRPANGTWYIRDFVQAGNNIAVQFGLPGDTPFTYVPRPAAGAPLLSNVGVVRREGTSLRWYFNTPGMLLADGARIPTLSFGLFGDNLIPGPWENQHYTNPAVARLFDNHWTFFIYRADGTVHQEVWGGNGDIPKVQDYDGDGIFDVAVFRPSDQKTYVIQSSTGEGHIYNFGTGTADHTVRGDYTGDGVDDISFWEPLTGMFTTMRSDHGFSSAGAQSKDPDYYEELQLGLYQTHLPLSWNYRDGRFLYTVIDHQTGLRYWRPGNSSINAPVSMQWGLPGDSQG